MESDKNKILLPEQLEKDIDAQNLPKLIVIFPEHPKKATMESYLTRGLRYEKGFEPPGNFDFFCGKIFRVIIYSIFYLGILYAKARCDVRFGIINQLPNQDITHFKVEMQCPGLHKPVAVRKTTF